MTWWCTWNSWEYPGLNTSPTVTHNHVSHLGFLNSGAGFTLKWGDPKIQTQIKWKLGPVQLLVYNLRKMILQPTNFGENATIYVWRATKSYHKEKKKKALAGSPIKVQSKFCNLFLANTLMCLDSSVCGLCFKQVMVCRGQEPFPGISLFHCLLLSQQTHTAHRAQS